MGTKMSTVKDSLTLCSLIDVLSVSAICAKQATLKGSVVLVEQLASNLKPRSHFEFMLYPKVNHLYFEIWLE